VREIGLGERHRPTGHTRHLVEGSLVPPSAILRISRYGDDPGLYLL
jgi:hypothetical protein